MHAATLRRIADETGGSFYTANTASGLPEDLRYTGRGVTTVEEHELWHMPIVLILLVGLLCAEWGYRRAVGLA
jgi:gamma-glutamyltranspeptidase